MKYQEDASASSVEAAPRAAGHCLGCANYSGEECHEPALNDFEQIEAGEDVPEIGYMTKRERKAHVAAGFDVACWRGCGAAEYGDEDHPLAVTAHDRACPGFEPAESVHP